MYKVNSLSDGSQSADGKQAQQSLPIATSPSAGINHVQSSAGLDHAFIVNGVNMFFWYPEAFLEPLLEKYLAQDKLHTTSKTKGIVLQESGDILKLGVGQDLLTVSMSQPIVVGTTTSARDSLYDSLHQNIKEIFTWNQMIASQLEPNLAQLIQKHSLLCPINLGSVHWALLCITLKVLKHGDVFYPAAEVDIKVYDTKSMLGKNNKTLQEQLNDILLSLVPNSLRTNIIFNVTAPKIKQQPASDAHACGALVTEMARCFISNNGQIPELQIAEACDYTLNEILKIRTAHLKILDDTKFKEMQQQQVIYRFEQKQTEWNDFALRNAIYELVLSLPESDKIEFTHTIDQLISAETISFDHLSKDNYIPDPKMIDFFTREYQAEYLGHISNLKVQFEDLNHAKFYMCVSYAQKKCGEKIQAWFGVHYAQLQPFLDEIFLPEQVTNYKDNGLDKLMEVWKDFLQCMKHDCRPTARKALTHQFNTSRSRSFSDEEYIILDKDDEASDAKLPFVLKFIGNRDQADQPQNGHITCQIGPEFAATCKIYYTGEIKNGTTNGKGVLYVFSHTQGIITFVSGMFWKGGFTCNHGDCNNLELLNLLHKHLLIYAMDLRLPHKDSKKVLANRPSIEQYGRAPAAHSNHAKSNIPMPPDLS